MKIEKAFKEGADFEYLRRVLMRETTEGSVPILELVVDAEIMSETTGIDYPAHRLRELLVMDREPTEESIQLGVRLIELSVTFCETVGYDYATMTPLIPIQRTPLQPKENPQQNGKVRTWQNEHQGLIMNRDDFDAFEERLLTVECLQGITDGGDRVDVEPHQRRSYRVDGHRVDPGQ